MSAVSFILSRPTAVAAWLLIASSNVLAWLGKWASYITWWIRECS